MIQCTLQRQYAAIGRRATNAAYAVEAGVDRREPPLLFELYVQRRRLFVANPNLEPPPGLPALFLQSIKRLLHQRGPVGEMNGIGPVSEDLRHPGQRLEI